MEDITIHVCVWVMLDAAIILGILEIDGINIIYFLRFSNDVLTCLLVFFLIFLGIVLAIRSKRKGEWYNRRGSFEDGPFAGGGWWHVGGGSTWGSGGSGWGSGDSSGGSFGGGDFGGGGAGGDW